MGTFPQAAPEADPVAPNLRQALTNPSASSPSGSELTHRDPPHPIPIEHIDPDALKVVRRLKRYGHTAYLVGGCVRDLLLGRTPKDFDIGTSARPRQVKHLFRNSRIIGRRFRLAHIVFGKKVIEVATFRATQEVPEIPEVNENGEADWGDGETPTGGSRQAVDPNAPRAGAADKDEDLLIKSDNVFGTPEQDAFRRDFTVNGLFYDPETQQVIDHVGGMADLERRVLRTIGDPETRFKEDPVRIVRAVKFAARLQFAIEPKTFDAMIRHRQELAKAAPPRLAEEVVRLAQGGAGAESFRLLYELGVLQHIAPSVSQALARANEKATADAGAAGLFWRHLEAIDRWPAGPMDLSRAVALAAVYGPVYRAALEDNPQLAQRDPGVLFFNAIRPAISERLLSRREADRMKLIYVAQRRLETAPGAGDGPAPQGAPQQGGQGQPNQGGRRRRRRGGGAKGLATRDYFREAVAFFRIDAMAKGKSPELWERWEALLPQAPPTREVLPFRRREENQPLGAEPSEDEPLPTQAEIDAVNRLPDDEDYQHRGRGRRRRGGGRLSQEQRERERMARTKPGESGGVPETPQSDAEFEPPTNEASFVERPSVETGLPKLQKPKRAREHVSVADEPAPPPPPKLPPAERIAKAMASDAPLINPYTNRPYVPRKFVEEIPIPTLAATATSAAHAAGVAMSGGGGGGGSPSAASAQTQPGAAGTTGEPHEPYTLDEFEGDVEPEVPDRVPSGASSNTGDLRVPGAPASPGAPRPSQQQKEGQQTPGAEGGRRRRRRGRRGRGRGGRPDGPGGPRANTPSGGSQPASSPPPASAAPRNGGNGGNGGGGGSNDAG